MRRVRKEVSAEGYISWTRRKWLKSGNWIAFCQFVKRTILNQFLTKAKTHVTFSLVFVPPEATVHLSVAL